ncbi:hypothetical protein FQR65_LT11818 [Abscondita terminalis]|nr:hypothetical protein FQR65_LT11818 [Abscondita terminalis]
MSGNGSTSSADEATTSGSKKRQRNLSDWKKKKVEPPCTCKQKCMDNLSDQDKVQILSKLYTDKSKNIQDTFLQGLIELKPIERRRKRLAEGGKQRGSNFVCFVMHRNNRIPVCKQAFMRSILNNFFSSILS